MGKTAFPPFPTHKLSAQAFGRFLSQDTQGPRLLDDKGRGPGSWMTKAREATLVWILWQQPHLEARTLKVAQLLESVD